MPFPTRVMQASHSLKVTRVGDNESAGLTNAYEIVSFQGSTAFYQHHRHDEFIITRITRTYTDVRSAKLDVTTLVRLTHAMGKKSSSQTNAVVHVMAFADHT